MGMRTANFKRLEALQLLHQQQPQPSLPPRTPDSRRQVGLVGWLVGVLVLVYVEMNDALFWGGCRAPSLF